MSIITLTTDYGNKDYSVSELKAKIYKFPAISIRFFNAYGPRSRTSGAYGAVFGVFLAQKLEGFDFYFLVDDENKAKRLFKYSDNQEKIRFISVDYDFNKQNAKEDQNAVEIKDSQKDSITKKTHERISPCVFGLPSTLFPHSLRNPQPLVFRSPSLPLHPSTRKIC